MAKYSGAWTRFFKARTCRSENWTSSFEELIKPSAEVVSVSVFCRGRNHHSLLTLTRLSGRYSLGESLGLSFLGEGLEVVPDFATVLPVFFFDGLDMLL
jgi:hypothetical protein